MKLRAPPTDTADVAPSDQPSRARENLRLLADRKLAPFFLGNLVANCGTWFLVLTAGILVYRKTGSAFLLGAVGFSQFAGVLLLAPWTGAAADRFDRRRLLFATQGGASITACTLAALVMLDHATAATVIAFVLVIGLVQAFTFPALQAILPDLVPPDRLGSAIALMALTFNLARGIGPLTAALVIATAGLGEAFVVNALAYLALVVGLLAIHPQAPPRRPLRPRFRDSIALVRRRPRLASLMLVSSAAAIAIDPVNTLSPAFAASVWNHSDALAGVLLGAFSAGALTAVLTVAGRPGQLRRQLVSRLSLLVGGMVAFSIAPTMELGLGALAVAGFGFLATSTTTIKELQLSIDSAQRGRIMALWAVAFLGVRPIASLVDGALASAASPRVSALAMALPALVIVAILVVRGRPPPDRGPGRGPPAARPGDPGSLPRGEGPSACTVHAERVRILPNRATPGAMTRRYEAMATHELHIDTSIPVRREASRCHNRWHPDIPPALACLPGDDVLVTTRDAVDGQFSMSSTHEDVPRADRTIVHPLTGPIFVDGAEPGDLLVVEILGVEPGAFGYTAQIPGFGFLRDEFPAPFLARWEIADNWANSPDLPGIRIPGRPFMGIMGLAPSRDLLAQISVRERALAASGADVALPEPRGAVPEDAAIASEALRTKPPRENGGNLDVKHMVAGTRVLFPVWTEGALFSAGDGHFAQGDGEVCGTAIETAATLHVRFDLVKAGAADRGTRDVTLYGNEADASIGDYVATTGLSVYADAGGQAEDLNGAVRSALRNMIDHLSEEYGYTRQQAYAICSVAVDLKISEIVDAPNFVVTAQFPLDVVA